MAEAWGVPPWEIHHHPGSALWAGRWAAYKQELAEITKPKA